VLKIALGVFIGIVAAIFVLRCPIETRSGADIADRSALVDAERDRVAERFYSDCLEKWKHSSPNDWNVRKAECRREADALRR
jgi:hypothetical protein